MAQSVGLSWGKAQASGPDVWPMLEDASPRFWGAFLECIQCDCNKPVLY